MEISKMAYKSENDLYRVLAKNTQPYNTEKPYQPNDTLKITNKDHPLYGGLVYYQRVQFHPRTKIYWVSKYRRG